MRIFGLVQKVMNKYQSILVSMVTIPDGEGFPREENLSLGEARIGHH